MIVRFRKRAEAVRSRGLPPVEGPSAALREQAQIDFMDYAMLGDAEAQLDDGILILSVDLRPRDPTPPWATERAEAELPRAPARPGQPPVVHAGVLHPQHVTAPLGTTGSEPDVDHLAHEQDMARTGTAVARRPLGPLVLRGSFLRRRVPVHLVADLAAQPAEGPRQHGQPTELTYGLPLEGDEPPVPVPLHLADRLDEPPDHGPIGPVQDADREGAPPGHQGGRDRPVSTAAATRTGSMATCITQLAVIRLTRSPWPLPTR